MASSTLYTHILDFNIDRYFNPFVPRNHLYVLPQPISHFLGYRYHASKDPPTLLQYVLSFLATVAGLCVVGAVYTMAPGIRQWHPPTLIASLGASAVLEYTAIRSPLAQPRNSIIGHTLSAIVGTGIAKAFMLAPGFFAKYDWVAGAVACACATLAMTITNTVHPPGGATAILACVEPTVIAMGWTYVPTILVACLLMCGVALLFNNTLRQYPTFWWTPEEVGWKLPGARSSTKEDAMEKDAEKDVDSSDAESKDIEKGDSSNGDLTQVGSSHGEPHNDETLQREFSREIEFIHGLEAVHVAPYMIRMPPGMELSEGDVETLQHLMIKLRTQMETGHAT